MTIVQFNTNQLPTRAEMWWEEANNNVGMALFPVTGQPYGFIAHKSAGPAQFDQFTHGFFIKAGVYTISWLGSKLSGAGIVDWYLDPAFVSPVAFLTGQDWYIAAGGANTTLTSTLTVPTDGWHVLSGIVSSKNASSSGYDLPITRIILKQASD